jgi:uncharacterized protein (UPF0548 family)
VRLLFGQADLAELLKLQPSPLLSKRRLPSSAHRDVAERPVAKERNGDPEVEGAFSRIERAILRFEVYDPTRVKTLLERYPVQEGDTVGLQWLVAPPTTLFFGVRVIGVVNRQVNDGRFKTSVQYHTLEGHPVTGEETWSVEKDAKTGIVKVTFGSWSVPGTPLTSLLGPLTRMMQRDSTAACLNWLESRAAKS